MSETVLREKLLVQQIAAGDKDAFRTLFDEYKDLVFTFVYGLTHSRVDAEEVVQDVFLKLWQTRENLTTIEVPKSYIYRMARNRTLDLLAAKGRQAKLVSEVWANMKESEEVTAEILAAKESRELIEEAIRQLPARKQQVIRLSREAGMTHDEIAEKLGISKQTVKNNLSEALKQIKTLLEKHSALLAAAFWLLHFELVF
ncbi:MAG: RNA polymerase sigma factor [Flavisolibacter sp.]